MNIVVPNPYTSLSKIPHEHKWFSVVALTYTFWACPLDSESTDLFAFKWENPHTGRKQQYRQLYDPKVSPRHPTYLVMFWKKNLEQFLASWCLPAPELQLLDYVDDHPDVRIEVSVVTRDLLNFLADRSLRVSRHKLQFVENNKFQFVEKEAKYLGHLIMKGSAESIPGENRCCTPSLA